MKNAKLVLKVLSGAALALILAAPAFAPAAAEDSIYVPLFTYRTGPFAGSGTPIADGMHDYLTMLNERDGGIGGVKLNVDECETGYDTKKGLECYDSVKPKGPVIVNPWSTGITLSLIPKASVDKIPILSMAYGLSASAKGDVFPWIFNPPATYWDGLSEILKYIGDGSIEKLKGKTIGYLYFDAGFGKEPIPMFQDLSKDYGFALKLYPVAPASMQDQSAQWLDVRRDKPDFVDHVRLGRDELRPQSRRRSKSAIPWKSSSRSGGLAKQTYFRRATAPRGSRRSTGTASAPITPRCKTSKSGSSTPERARRPRRSSAACSMIAASTIPC